MPHLSEHDLEVSYVGDIYFFSSTLSEAESTDLRSIEHTVLNHDLTCNILTAQRTRAYLSPSVGAEE